ncbi:MAG: glycoside hydrolase family 9 protein [Anaerolineales bacterium]
MHRKITITTVLIALILLAGCGGKGSSAGQLAPDPIPGEVVYIPFPVEIKLDGDLSDWAGIPVNEVVDPDPRDPKENGSFQFRVAADDENFYITMQMPDENIIAGEHRNEYWNEDSFEFYLNLTDRLTALSYDEGIFQININATDIGNTDPDSLTITGTRSFATTVRGFVFKTKDGWGFEAAVPFGNLFKPEHGKEIGFQAQINGAAFMDRNVQLVWGKADNSNSSWENPSKFGRGLFFKIGSTDIPTTDYAVVIPTPVPTPVPVEIPELISVNQTGYLTTAPKIALLDNDATEPLDWQLVDSSGSVVLSGQTSVKGDDKVSRTHLHEIDFSSYTTPGSSYQLKVGEISSVPFDIAPDIYSTLRYDALAYFYYNRSGIEIETQYVGEEYARPAGHLTDNEITCYKGQDADGKNWPGCDYTLDASKGWYDAGDYGKYVVNGGISVWTLMNLYERFPEAYPDGSLKIPENGNGVPDILDEARWEMEFLLGMQVPEGEPLAGMAHHKLHDRTWAGIPLMAPTEYDNDNQHLNPDGGRYVYAPSTAATLNLAATAAQCARIWAEIDPAFSDRCLQAAETAWGAARANPEIYAGDNPGDGGGNYDGTIVADEFYWAAAELFITTGGQEYLDFLEKTSIFGQVDQFDWGRIGPLGTISLAMEENDLPNDQAVVVKENIIAFADELLAIMAEDGFEVPIDGDYPWGSNGTILNNMILLATAHDLTGEAKYLEAVQIGMDYILGRNALNKSFVSGYGEYPMQHPHHRFWANMPERGFPAPPPGAVSGGPNFDANDPDANAANLGDEAASRRYLDTLESYSTNEVTINWNAPLVWVATYLDLVTK